MNLTVIGLIALAAALAALARYFFKAGKKEEQRKNALEVLDGTTKADAVDADLLTRGPAGSLDRLRSKYSREE